MPRFVTSFSKRICRNPNGSCFLKCQKGATTIEFVLWLPVFFMALCMIIDATMIFSNRTHALRVVQDANRSFAIGRLTTPEETEGYISSRISQLSPSATINTTVAQGVITTSVVMPSTELAMLGIFDVALDFNVGVTAQHMAEN